jgi:GTPase SAR1 family protein
MRFKNYHILKDQEDMYLIFVVGTAGCGKSLLTATFSDWLRGKKQSVTCVNLDAAALSLPYTPDVDVRDYVRTEEVMEKYGLGPNGAVVMSADLVSTEIDSIRTEIETLNSNYVIIDTPGQMELFAFRASGPYIVKELSDEPKALLYLFDATFSSQPLNYVSNMFLATAVYTRFLVPQLYILSKTDLVQRRVVKKTLEWSSRAGALDEALEAEVSDTNRLMARGVSHLVSRLGLSFLLVPVSSKKQEGFINIHSILTRIFAGGEEPI